jgi:cytochrome c oxidase subunit 4
MSSAIAETAPTPEPTVRAHGDDHPHDRDYIVIAVILAVITALEVGTYYLDPSTAALILMLMPMMVVKFAMVAWFFMHLKQVASIFRRLFVTGFAVAVVVYSIVLLTFDKVF